MNITREQLEQLARIYNTFLNINTRGEDTFIMADCLRALEQTIKQIDEANTSSSNGGGAASTKSNEPAFVPEVVSE